MRPVSSLPVFSKYRIHSAAGKSPYRTVWQVTRSPVFGSVHDRVSMERSVSGASRRVSVSPLRPPSVPRPPSLRPHSPPCHPLLPGGVAIGASAFLREKFPLASRHPRPAIHVPSSASRHPRLFRSSFTLASLFCPFEERDESFCIYSPPTLEFSPSHSQSQTTNTD